jgi:hypothetical protein
MLNIELGNGRFINAVKVLDQRTQELPCAVTRTVFPALSWGTIWT